MSKSEYKITIQIKKIHLGAIHKEHMQVGRGSEVGNFCSQIYGSNIPLQKQTNKPKVLYVLQRPVYENKIDIVQLDGL